MWNVFFLHCTRLSHILPDSTDKISSHCFEFAFVRRNMKDAAGKSACTLGPYFGPDLVMNGRNPHPWWPQKTLGFVDQRETLSLLTFSFWSLNKYVLYIGQIQFVICRNTKCLSSKDICQADPNVKMKYSGSEGEKIILLRMQKNHHSMPAAVSQDSVLLFAPSDDTFCPSP